MASRTQTLHVAEGYPVYGAEETHDFTYVVIDGVVRLECRDHRGGWAAIQHLGPGEFFGMSWRPTVRPRQIRAVAATDADVGLITRQAIAGVFGAIPPERRWRFMAYPWLALSRLVVRSARLAPLGVFDRIVQALWALPPPFGPKERSGRRITVRVDRAALARMAVCAEGTIAHRWPAVLRSGRVERLSDGSLLVRPPAEVLPRLSGTSSAAAVVTTGSTNGPSRSCTIERSCSRSGPAALSCHPGLAKPSPSS